MFPRKKVTLFSVRGRRAALGALVVLPSAVPVITILGVARATTLMGVAAGREDLVLAERLRILARGTANLDALYIYGAYTGAAAFAAAALALLGAAASIDGAGKGWSAPIVVGAAGVGVHFAFGGTLVVAAALVVASALAALAARNSAFVRSAPDFVEAREWLAEVASGALCVALAVGLLDFATMMVAERQGLESVVGDLERTAALATARHAGWLGLGVDAGVGFAIVAVVFFAARGPDRRSPAPGMPGLALASALFTFGVLFLSRRQVKTLVETGAHSSVESRSKLPAEPTGAYAHGEMPIVIIDLHPSPILNSRTLTWFDRELGIDADGETPWPRVMTAIMKEMRARNHWMPHRGANTSPPDLSIRLRPPTSGLGWYAAFLAGTEPLLRITLAYYALDPGPDVFRDLPDSATLNDVVAEYTRRQTAFTVELPKDF